MKRMFLFLMILVSGCGGDLPGSYDGTLTIKRTGSEIVTSAYVDLVSGANDVTLWWEGEPAIVTCHFGGLKWEGPDVSFDCYGQPCSCDVETDAEILSLTITTASGKAEDASLTLTFSGEEMESGAAFSATYEGTNAPDNI